jgi:hypothetical protein
MEGTVSCSNCGASNDPIVSNCQFCGGRLESDVDPMELPEMTMLNNAAEWLGRLETVATDRFAMGAARRREDPLESYLSGEDDYSLTQIRSNAEKYINLLSVRVSNNPALEDSLEELNRRRRQALDDLEKQSKSQKKLSLIVLAVIFLLLILSMIMMSLPAILE